ncbi:MAG: chemotaxis protein CheX [Phycisphaerales bacterium]|nr:chemotaxis protein CheX [Phycisphaerales bacterium]
MNVKYINPFIESVCAVFETMLNISPKRERVRIAQEPKETDPRMLTSIVGISGGASGVVALRFPMETALQLAGRFLGTQYTESNDEVIDAISELANMVAGSAKAKFELSPAPQLGLPSVIEGRGYKVRYPAKAAWLEVPFTSSAGDFAMEVTFSEDLK